MEWFDDIQLEELENFDFIEEDILGEDEPKSFTDYLKSNIDYWLWTQIHLISAEMLLQSLVSLVFFQRFLSLLLLLSVFSTVLIMSVWRLRNRPLNSPLTLKLLYSKPMNEHIPNVLPHIQELKLAWRKQDFMYTKQQQEEYDLLLATRRERVKQFYAEGRVFKGSYKAKEVEI